MPNENPNPTDAEPLPRYVRAPKLIELLFDSAAKPSLRWVRQQQVNRTIPFVKCGRFVWFDPRAVKACLDARALRARGSR